MSSVTEHTRDLLLVAAGGAAGAVLRHSVGRMVGPAPEGAIPWHTLVVNLTGAFALGALLVVAARHGWPGWWRPLLGVGLLGGYTTFSAVSLEAADLLLRGSWGAGLGYLALTGGVAAAGAVSGIAVARLLV